MAEQAAENFAKALERVRDNSLTGEEHAQAVDELLVANARLLQKQGVDVQGSRRTIGQIISGALLVAVCVAMTLLIIYSKEGADTASKARDTAQVAKETVHELRLLQHGLLLNQRQGCERSNEKQRSNVGNLELDKQNALGEARVLEGIGIPITPAIQRRIDEDHEFAAGKQRTIDEQVEAVKEVAKKRGSVETNCKRAYPLNQPAAAVLGRHGDSAARSGLPGPGALEVALASR